MPIRYRCTNCRQLLSIATRRAGAEMPCPTCGTVTQVPWTSEPDGPSQKSAPAPPIETVEASPPIAGAPSRPPAATASPRQESASMTAVRETHDNDDEPSFNFRRKANSDDELDMTPMVDMTFLLLIFFMVTATFSQQKTLQLPPPDPEKKGASRTMEIRDDVIEASLRVEIDAQNGVAIEEEKVSDLTGLAGLLREKMRSELKTEVVLSIDPKALHETVVRVVDACNEAGMQKIRIASRAGDDATP